MTVLCRQCKSGGLQDRGALPRGRKFAGTALVPTMPGGRLYACDECGISFRHPILPASTYRALYANAGGSVWTAKQNLRRDQQLTVQTVRTEFPNGARVLDVGCYTGDLLMALGEKYHKFGIEPSVTAGEEATRRGVAIVGASVEELDDMEQSFDVVVTMNLIEHMPDPLAFLKTLAARTAKGGLILIGTGDGHSRAWQLLGPSYWYCQNFEHITFVSKQWCQWSALRAGVELVSCSDAMRYETGAHVTSIRRAQNFVELGLKWAASIAERLLLALVHNETREKGPRLGLGRPGMFRDHLFAVYAKR